MTSVKQLSKLFGSLSSGDQGGATAVAREITDLHDRRGQRAAAQELRAALTSPSTMHEASAPISLPGVVKELPGPPLDELVLPSVVRQEVESLALEWQHREGLVAEGVSRRRTVLFHGPPGCGKTLTARSLGTLTGLPVLTARMSNLIASFLGETGANLRSLFALVERQPCVLLLDEFEQVLQKLVGASS